MKATNRHQIRHSGLLRIGIVAGLIIMVLTVGCGYSGHDERLRDVAREIADSLGKAEIMFKSIDKESLQGGDRHYYDFLSLKIDDKNYVRHTSDSLYLTIKDYYEHHQESGLYPEVLYYGGRVYSDMGDYPTALKYFHEALDELPEDTEDLELKSRILSQTGRLLNQLYLYSEAQEYVEKNVQVNRLRKNKVNLVYNLELLGIIHYNQNNFTTAKRYFEEALKEGEGLPQSFAAKTHMHLARTESQLGNHTVAIALIRETPENVKPISKDWAIAYAAEIYHAGGVYDTAYLYARKVIDNPRSLKKKTGYKVLLAPELAKYIPKDSLLYYVSEYNKYVEEYLERNDASQVSLQLSLYNYKKKEAEIERMSSSRSSLVLWGGIVIVILVIWVIMLWVLRISNKRHLKEFEVAIEKVSSLYKREKKEVDQSTYQEYQAHLKRQEEEKRLSEIKDSLLKSAEDKKTVIPKLPIELLSSEVYSKIQDNIKSATPLPEDSPIWVELEKAINLCYPDFTRKLSELMNGKETVQEIRTCMLVKLQLPAKTIAQLLSISPSGFGSRKDSVSKKMFGIKLGAMKTDIVIHLL